MTEEQIIQGLMQKHGLANVDPATVFNRITAQVVAGTSLKAADAQRAMVLLMSGAIAEGQIASFLTAMHMKGETPDEVAGSASIMRACAASVVAPEDEIYWRDVVTVDSCGTGGGTVPTFNISTTVAFILSVAGLTVAKHGNRAITSKSGSADVFESLGVSLSLTPEQVGKCIVNVKIGFLFAPAFHPATRHVQKVRKMLSHKTFFNILGPLTNPTAPKYQFVGVYEENLTELVARSMARLKVSRAIVAHGKSRKSGECMDELSLLGTSKVTELKAGKIRSYELDPRKFGFSLCKAADLAGGSGADNAKIMRDIFSGAERGPRRDIVVLNAAAGLYVAGKAKTIKDGCVLASAIIDSGKAGEKLTELVEFVGLLKQ